MADSCNGCTVVIWSRCVTECLQLGVFRKTKEVSINVEYLGNYFEDIFTVTRQWYFVYRIYNYSLKGGTFIEFEASSQKTDKSA